jgi:PQQ-like domain
MGLMRTTAWLWLPLFLSACGGGGGGDSTPATPSLSFSPSSLTSTFVTGRTTYVTLNATASGSVSGTVYVIIVDTKGVIEPRVSLTATSNPLTYAATFSPSAALQPGQYSGSLQVNVCLDQACTRPFGGSPYAIPYNFTVQVPPPWATLEQASISAAFSVGFPWTNTLMATQFTGYDNSVKVTDSTGTLQPDTDVARLGNGAYAVRVSASPSLPAGHYSGTAQLNLCRDSNCLPPFQGTAVPFTFDITVRALKPLLARPGLSDWNMFQGNAAHTGYVPITVDVSKIFPRWGTAGVGNILWQMPATVASAGHIYTSAIKKVVSISESDGRVDWVRDFSAYPSLGPPAASGGRVFVATTGYSDTFMWALDAADGSTKYQAPFFTQWDTYLAPTVDRGVVFTGDLYGFSTSTGSRVLSSGFSDFDQWTPAVDATYAYAYVGGTNGQPNSLKMVDRASGTIAATINYSGNVPVGYSMNAAAIIGAPGSVFGLFVDSFNNATVTNNLINFDTVAKSVRWSVAGRFAGNPAYTNGLLFATNRSPLQLEARRESDGVLQWRWAPPGAETDFIGDVLVTDNLVFVSTDVATYAIDRATHTSVWRYARASRVSITANGTLVLSPQWAGAPGGGILAFDTN